jgi:hypothetical protein
VARREAADEGEVEEEERERRWVEEEGECGPFISSASSSSPFWWGGAAAAFARYRRRCVCCSISWTHIGFNCWKQRRRSSEEEGDAVEEGEGGVAASRRWKPSLSSSQKYRMATEKIVRGSVAMVVVTFNDVMVCREGEGNQDCVASMSIWCVVDLLSLFMHFPR